jgi:hypothetical protein
VLFPDQAPEFARDVLDALCQPLESGKAVLARASARVAVLAERGGREQLGGCHDALAAAAVESHLEHRLALSLVSSSPTRQTDNPRVAP